MLTRSLFIVGFLLLGVIAKLENKVVHGGREKHSASEPSALFLSAARLHRNSTNSSKSTTNVSSQTNSSISQSNISRNIDANITSVPPLNASNPQLNNVSNGSNVSESNSLGSQSPHQEDQLNDTKSPANETKGVRRYKDDGGQLLGPAIGTVIIVLGIVAAIVNENSYCREAKGIKAEMKACKIVTKPEC
jgi:hypothetical protein